MSLEINIEKKLNSFTLNSSFSTNANRTALLGASGSGKSMILKCIAGIETPDKGVIKVNGRPLFD
ncbi:ATP-binding cassette domain-containing protein [Tetragenococcus halophilus]|nr:ATP-binding cassette domain-containing protein [Tetragenococcus halophilus]